jgi:YihY family inner membrane protein
VARAEASVGTKLERRLPGVLRLLIDELEETDVLLYASGLAFYALVSVVPLVIIVMWIVATILGDQRVNRFAQELARVAPPGLGADQTLERVAALGTQIGLPAVLAALWPATAYGAGLSRAFRRLAPDEHARIKTKAIGLRGRLLAFLVLLPVFAIGGIVASYLGTQALGDSVAGIVLGPVIALVAGFLVAAVTIALLFRIFPPEPLEGRQILRGTVFTAAGVSILSLGFALYLKFGADFQERYASSGIAGIVLLAVWLFGTDALLLLGYRVALRTPVERRRGGAARGAGRMRRCRMRIARSASTES